MEVLYPRCASLDVHKDTVFACVRLVEDATVHREVQTFSTTTPGLLALSVWLGEQGCTHVAMEGSRFTGSRFGTCSRTATSA